MMQPRLYKKNFPSFLANSKGSWIPTKNNNIKQLDDKKNILLLGVKGKATQWIPKDKEQLWIYHLHYFDYAADDLQSKDQYDPQDQDQTILVLKPISPRPTTSRRVYR